MEFKPEEPKRLWDRKYFKFVIAFDIILIIVAIIVYWFMWR